MTEVLNFTAGGGLGPVDSQLLVSASLNRSAEEMAADVKGVVTPAQAVQRVRDILKSRDVFSYVEKQKLLIEDSYFLLGKLKSQMQGFVSDTQAGAFARSVKQTAELLASASLGNEASMMRVAERHAAAMGAAIAIGFEMTLLELQKRHSEIEEAEVFEVLQEALPLAVASLAETVELDKKRFDG